MSNTLIIVGSARREGNTKAVARELADRLQADIVDLLDLEIAPFRYDQAYAESDEFQAFVSERMLAYDRIVFASPVYWYTMSGVMKHFFDRLSDLLKSRKELGRRLRGKHLAVMSCAGDADINPGFYEPFRLSAAYLGMYYGPEWHGWVGEDGVVLESRSENTSDNLLTGIS